MPRGQGTSQNGTKPKAKDRAAEAEGQERLELIMAEVREFFNRQDRNQTLRYVLALEMLRPWLTQVFGKEIEPPYNTAQIVQRLLDMT